MGTTNSKTEISSQRAQTGLASEETEGWESLVRELEPLAGSLLESPALGRLRAVTFLGVLSPRYHLFVDSPLFRKRPAPTPTDDGSRYSHSLHAAHLFLRICRRLQLAEKTQRYAVAWGIAHDIATWPLSHTGEPAFAAITRTPAKKLRAMMIQGAPELPHQLTLAGPLQDIGVDPDSLIGLFDKKKRPEDAELGVLWEIIRSPITPDTLEGMWRCGRVFGVAVPSPDEVVGSLTSNLLDPVLVTRKASTIVVRFWKRKAEIYDKFINRPDVIRWESAWVIALLKEFKHVNLVESLELPEEELVARVLATGLPDEAEVAQMRYKAPLVYFVKPRQKRMLDADSSPLGLEEFLRKATRSE